LRDRAQRASLKEVPVPNGEGMRPLREK